MVGTMWSRSFASQLIVLKSNLVLGWTPDSPWRVYAIWEMAQIYLVVTSCHPTLKEFVKPMKEPELRMAHVEVFDVEGIVPLCSSASPTHA